MSVGAAEASWTRGLAGRHGSYVRTMAEKMVQDGMPDDTSAWSVLDKAAGAKNIMSGIRGCSPAEWVWASDTATSS